MHAQINDLASDPAAPKHVAAVAAKLARLTTLHSTTKETEGLKACMRFPLLLR